MSSTPSPDPEHVAELLGDEIPDAAPEASGTSEVDAQLDEVLGNLGRLLED